MAATTIVYLALILTVFTVSTFSSKRGVSKVVQAKSMTNDSVTGMLDDWRYASNCGTVPFNFSWTPSTFRPNSTITFKLDFVAPHNLESLVASASLWFFGDKDPFLDYEKTFECDDIKDYLPCPMKKGSVVNRTSNISKVSALARYPGKYIVVAKLRNEKKQMMLCFNMTIDISE